MVNYEVTQWNDCIIYQRYIGRSLITVKVYVRPTTRIIVSALVDGTTMPVGLDYDEIGALVDDAKMRLGV